MALLLLCPAAYRPSKINAQVCSTGTVVCQPNFLSESQSAIAHSSHSTVASL